MSNAGEQRSFRELYPQRIDIIFLIFVSCLLLFIGLSLPVLTVRKLWEINTYSILSGVINLWDERYYGLAMIIFFFSIIFPIVKLIALWAVWFVRLGDDQRKRLIYFLEMFGKWSMLDVFVVAVMIVWVKLGALASARAENGIYFFGASIILAMVATSLQESVIRRHGS